MLELFLIAMIVISLTNAITHLWGVLFETGDELTKRVHKNKAVGWLLVLVVVFSWNLFRMS